ncbi:MULTISPECIES: DUF2283 domain-containing protein [unclassified Bacillus (in: firmicutes)]|uniref:DUF2283 domain-containing protein n=1 Tax=unclassified Bacillus (in: firmicutes) TaxID=185979 RepID=UPI000D046ED0|nr:MULTISPECIES: DUF2283 domain-containing protein [unclassified Bacillus (in: firmicutes)]PRR88560.1 hypothetical protein C6W21_17600 [Bacillus sp. NMCN1]PRR96337.1 hypothetical protein C6W20_17240 [Bacillus sp. NMCN6]
MKRNITYDQTIDIGYIDLIPPGIGTIKETIELDVNECVNADIDKQGRVAGLELFAEEAEVLKHAPVYEDELSLRFTDQEVLSTYHLSGIEFQFSTLDHNGLIGFTIVEPLRYNVKRKTRKNRFEWSKRFF